MLKPQQNETDQNKSPIKEYKGIHNLNLDKFYDSELSFTKKITTKRNDIDYIKENIKTLNDLKSYDSQLIKEYSPWSGHSYDTTINVAPLDNYNDEHYNLSGSKQSG